MNRRTILAALATALMPWRILQAGSIPLSKPEWGDSKAIPLSVPKWCEKIMTWARTCLKRMGHWDFEGVLWNNASIGFMRGHLMHVHGHSQAEVDSMDTNEIVAVHDAHHDGKPYKQYVIPSTPANGMDKRSGPFEWTVQTPQASQAYRTQPAQTYYQSGSSCPNGNCPNGGQQRRHPLREAVRSMFGG